MPILMLTKFYADSMQCGRVKMTALQQHTACTVSSATLGKVWSISRMIRSAKAMASAIAQCEAGDGFALSC